MKLCVHAGSDSAFSPSMYPPRFPISNDSFPPFSWYAITSFIHHASAAFVPSHDFASRSSDSMYSTTSSVAQSFSRAMNSQ